MYVFLALLLLGVLIMAHEAGHFWAARASGIEVQEFAMGMGPLLAKWKSKKGTQFSVRLLPVGGFCQFYGEDEDAADPRAFNNQPVRKRIFTVLSGPAMNFIVALLVVVLYMSVLGLQTVVPRVEDVEPNAAQAGLMEGDVLLRVGSMEIETTDDVLGAIAGSAGEDVVLRILRAGEEMDITITPFYDEELSRYRVGFTFAQERVRVPLAQSAPFSVQYNIESVRLIVETLKNLIFKGEGAADVTGPVGTVYVIQEVTQQGGVDIYLELLALISVNLGVMNLLPIPGLDGSRLLFLLVEGIRRKPIRRELEGAIHGAGFILLMGLMLLLTYKDIMQIFMR
ncbi:MAG: site-2 protease family protein [Clostridia bacterium]|nr:site-2 protease family protein [Clostridia bacterium]MBQ4608838.1 site-2 protease family protein [Clostridia bacterium]MBQ6858926.1 site-2 protease family protein [Clostridia bacterium]MBQ7051410.1 site-2 protease family protein [Clostridia bacterium]